MITREIEEKVLGHVKGKKVFVKDVSKELGIKDITIAYILKERYDSTPARYPKGSMIKQYDCTAFVRKSRLELMHELLKKNICSMSKIMETVKISKERVKYLLTFIDHQIHKQRTAIYYCCTGKPFDMSLVAPVMGNSIDSDTPTVKWRRSGYRAPKKKIEPQSYRGYTTEELKEIGAIIEGEVSYNEERWLTEPILTERMKQL